MHFYTQVSKWFWNTYVWLPEGYVWEDIKSTNEVVLPAWNDLWTYPFVFAIVAIFLRFQILNKFVFSPIAVYLGIKNVKPKPPVVNEVLEELYKTYKTKTPDSVLSAACKKVDWGERKAERWLRQRKASSQVPKHSKFLECAWQLVYYTSMFFYGLYIMIKKPWLYDVQQCWYDYPFQNLDIDVWWYYMLSLSFYWSMIFTHFAETKRKDFWQMFFHHLLTIVLIVFSWTCNFVRIGSLVLILHDCADIPLHAAKICIYLGYKAVCDAIFALFAITWVLTRDCIFPFWILKNVLVDSIKIIPIFPAYYIFGSLLICLQVLHFYWTYFIFKIIAGSLVKGKVQDERSSSEIEFSDASDAEDDDISNGHKPINGYNNAIHQSTK